MRPFGELERRIWSFLLVIYTQVLCKNKSQWRHGVNIPWMQLNQIDGMQSTSSAFQALPKFDKQLDFL